MDTNHTSTILYRIKKPVHVRLFFVLAFALLIDIVFGYTSVANATTITPSLATYVAHPPIHILANTTQTPQGLTPTVIKGLYHLPVLGGSGTVAIIDAYHNPNIEADLAAFNTQFSLPPCTVSNKCLTIHRMATSTKSNSGWGLETALDVEWAHAIAPNAKILLVESESSTGSHLVSAIDYARARPDVVSVSMSWGGNEFKSEANLDSHFISKPTHPIVFTASSGDDGTGASWPAVSPYVLSVGGTSLSFDSRNHFLSEKAWNGSGGGISLYEAQPSYQKDYSIPLSKGKRATPDVAYAADPASGFATYHNGSWYVIGGTSAGAPQWAAIASLAFTTKQPLSLAKLYGDKATSNNDAFFRDIVSGKNGSCAYYCTARKHYDYVTGLGSPQTYVF